MIIENVAFRFDGVKSKARPGVLQQLAGKLSYTSTDVYAPGTSNEADRNIYRDTHEHVVELMKKKLMMLKNVLKDIHDERVNTMDSLTGTKHYLKNVGFLFRNAIKALIDVEADTVGRSHKVDPFAIDHKVPLGNKEASFDRTAEFSLKNLWNSIKNAVKKAFSAAYDFIKDGLSQVGQFLGIIKRSDARILKLANKLSAVLDEIEM